MRIFLLFLALAAGLGAAPCGEMAFNFLTGTMDCLGVSAGGGDAPAGASNLLTVGAVVIVGATGEVDEATGFSYANDSIIGASAFALRRNGPSLDINDAANSATFARFNTSSGLTALGIRGVVCLGPGNTSCTGTLHIQDTTATTGSTNFVVRAGAGQSGNILHLVAADGTTNLMRVTGTTDGAIFLGPATSNGTQFGNNGNFLMVLGGDGTYSKSIAALRYRVPSSGWYGWSSSGDATASTDTAIQRPSAGLVEINNGTAGQYRDLILRVLQFTSGTEGTCDSSRRGAEVHTFGDAGVADTVRKCVKDGSDSYLWVSII